MTAVSQAEFAALMGWSRPYVSKLKKQGRLVMNEAGTKVLVEETKALLNATADPSKAAVSERHQRDRVEKHVGAYVSPNAPETPPPPAGDTGHYNYQTSRAQREHYLAELAKSEALQAAGELVKATAVEAAAFAAGRLTRDLVMGLPKQISADLAAITDAWELEQTLTRHLRRVLDDASRMSATDLERVLKPQS